MTDGGAGLGGDISWQAVTVQCLKSGGVHQECDPVLVTRHVSMFGPTLLSVKQKYYSMEFRD